MNKTNFSLSASVGAIIVNIRLMHGARLIFLWIKVLCTLRWLYTAGIWLYC